MKKFISIISTVAVILLAAICYNTAPKDVALRQTEFLKMPSTTPDTRLAMILIRDRANFGLRPLDTITSDSLWRAEGCEQGLCV